MKKIRLQKFSEIRTALDPDIFYTENWNIIRRIIYRRAKYTCQYCGKSDLGINAHHIVPLIKGGSNKLDNLICVCNQCHSILHPNNLNLEKKAKSSIINKYILDIRFDRQLFEEKKLFGNVEIFEDEQSFHSMEDNIIIPF